MERPHLRPRFLMLVQAPPEDVRAQMAERLKAHEDRFTYRVRSNAVLVWIKPPAQRFWSPALDTLLRPHPRGTLIVGRFGPHGSLMSGYFFLTLGLVFLTSFSLVWSMVQRSLGESPHCMIGSALGVVGIAGVWASARVGTWLAREQMAWLAVIVEGLGEIQHDEAAILAELVPPTTAPAATHETPTA